MFTKTKRAGVKEGRPPMVPTYVLYRGNAHRVGEENKSLGERNLGGVEEGDETTGRRYGGMGRGVTVQAGM